MGLIHLEHPNGEIDLVCRRCGTPIADKDWLMDANFRGRTGKAFLIKKAMNLKYG